jgi:hypothetical protein
MNTTGDGRDGVIVVGHGNHGHDLILQVMASSRLQGPGFKGIVNWRVVRPLSMVAEELGR